MTCTLSGCAISMSIPVSYTHLVEKVVNTVGAGDAFCCGFMTGILQGKDIPRCLLMGTMTSHDIIQMFNPY